MIFFTESEIDSYINEDLPYYDLTTEALEIGDKRSKITFVTRCDTVVSCSEEVKRVLERLGAHDVDTVPSGARLEAGERIAAAYGSAGTLHQAWKVCQNILEYACGVAGYTHEMVGAAREHNSRIEILTTRKTQPGVKKIALKSVLAGGGSIHRLGCSESFLLFDNHKNFFTKDELLKKIKEAGSRLIEKKLVVEADSIEEVLEFAEAGIRVFQLEKMQPEELRKSVAELRSAYSDLRLLATGGINLQNVQEYAASGVDGIVTTAPYFAKPVSIKVEISPL